MMELEASQFGSFHLDVNISFFIFPIFRRKIAIVILSSQCIGSSVNNPSSLLSLQLNFFCVSIFAVNSGTLGPSFDMNLLITSSRPRPHFLVAARPRVSSSSKKNFCFHCLTKELSLESALTSWLLAIP